MKPARRRELACRAKVEYDVSIRVVCDVLSISATCYFYKPTLANENAVIEDWLMRLTTTHKRWGVGALACALTSCVILKGLNGTISACTVSIGNWNLI